MTNQLQMQQSETHSTTTAMIFDPVAMNAMQAVADTMSKAAITVPAHLRSKAADCLAIVMQAAQWQMNPYAVAQKTHLVNGILGYESQLVNAVISSSRAITGRFKYEYGNWNGQPTADSWVKVGAVLAGEQEITWGEPLYPSTVTTKNSPLWKTAPKQQAAYLAVKYWARLYCPDVILGVYTKEELEQPEPRDITPYQESGRSKISKMIMEERLEKETNAKVAEQKQEPEKPAESPKMSTYDKYQNMIDSATTKQEMDLIGQSIANDKTLEPEEIEKLRDYFINNLK